MKNLALNITVFVLLLPCTLVCINSLALEIFGAAYGLIILALAVKTKRGRNTIERLCKQSIDIDNWLVSRK